MTTNFSKKIAALALAALTLGAGVTMNSGEAEARFGRKGLFAAGVVGALVTGALVASSHRAQAHPGYYDQGYGYAPAAQYYAPEQEYYAEPQPFYGHAPRHHRRHARHAGYSETGYAYRGPNCKLKNQQVWNGYGYELRQVQICR